MMLSYVKILRPHQWLKNLLLLFPPFFAGKIADPGVIQQILPALTAFSCAASVGYILNDIKDADMDKNNSSKKHRAIACGRIPIPIAILVAVVLYVTAMMISLSVHGEDRRFQWFLTAYLFISLIYSFFFKNVVILDIFFISFGFLIRVLAGGEAFGYPVSSWLFLTVFSVSLLLATGKRLGEMISLGEEAHNQRKILEWYSRSFLEGVVWFSAATALVMYALYTIEHKNALYYSVPVAAFGLLRYIFIVKQGNGDPTNALLQDRQIMTTGVMWFLMIGIIVYGK